MYKLLPIWSNILSVAYKLYTWLSNSLSILFRSRWAPIWYVHFAFPNYMFKILWHIVMRKVQSMNQLYVLYRQRYYPQQEVLTSSFSESNYHLLLISHHKLTPCFSRKSSNSTEKFDWLSHFDSLILFDMIKAFKSSLPAISLESCCSAA